MIYSELHRILCNIENIDLEFKEAKNTFDEKKVYDYCAALANGRGGNLILGVNDKREIVGTKAFDGTYNKLPNKIHDATGLNVLVEEVFSPEGLRVLCFTVNKHPAGQIISSKGHYKHPMRRGESLVEMDSQVMKAIISEVEDDFSDQVMDGLKIEHLDEKAISIAKESIAEHTGNEEYKKLTTEKFLKALSLKNEEGIKKAALILLGKKEVLDDKLPTAEIVFEWRKDVTQIQYDFRTTWRDAFYNISDSIWTTINARNHFTPIQEKLQIHQIPAFPDKPTREAILNAVSHRDYRITGSSIMIKACPQYFEISSPGGFPPGINVRNILHEHNSRNRRIAETLNSTGHVERSGQGMDTIFSFCIRAGKGMPDLSRTNENCVVLRIPTEIKDRAFIFYLITIKEQLKKDFCVEELIELENIRKYNTIENRDCKNEFLALGIIEKMPRSKEEKYVLSKKYYSYVRNPLKGNSRESIKASILDHIEKIEKASSKELALVFKNLDRKTIDNLLQELKRDEKIQPKGKARNSYWILK